LELIEDIFIRRQLRGVIVAVISQRSRARSESSRWGTSSKIGEGLKGHRMADGGCGEAEFVRQEDRRRTEEVAEGGSARSEDGLESEFGYQRSCDGDQRTEAGIGVEKLSKVEVSGKRSIRKGKSARGSESWCCERKMALMSKE
jgi:hypothetical protein